MRTIFIGGPLHLRQLNLTNRPYAISLNKPSFALKKRNGIIFTSSEHELFENGELPEETAIKYILNSPMFIKKHGEKKLSKYDEYIIASTIYQKCLSNPSLFKKIRHEIDGWEEIKKPLTNEKLKEMSVNKEIYYHRIRDILRTQTYSYYKVTYYSCLSKYNDVKYDSDLVDTHLAYKNMVDYIENSGLKKE